MKSFDDRKLKPKLTPMMQQWQDIKKEYSEYIIFFRAGDFYETFNEDAKIASKILNITLTARTLGEKRFPLAGVPYHAIDAYIAKMVENGYKVAMVEQLEDPKTAKKIVKRGVVQLISRGTITLPESLAIGHNNYLVAIYKEGDIIGLSALDLSTGEFLVTDFEGVKAKNLLEVELNRLNPSEIIVTQEFWEKLNIYFDQYKCSITYREDYFFDIEQSLQELRRLFDVLSLDGYGVNEFVPSIGAAGATLRYIKETQMRDSFPNITKISQIISKEHMVLDFSSIRNLELVENLRDRTEYGTLKQVLDNCKTSGGSRLLTTWLLRPSLNLAVIQRRIDATEELVSDSISREELRTILGRMNDVERLIGRICLGRSKPRDIIALRNSLELIPDIKSVLSKFKKTLIKDIQKNIDPLPEVVKIIATGIEDEVPASIKDGNVIREGYNEELDELRKIQRSGKSFLTSLEAREKVQTGIKNLKVRYNKVFGYYIEIPKASASNAPQEYERKQTLVNAERFITPELKEYEEKILNAEEKILVLEEKLFDQISEEISQFAEAIQQDANYCAIIDVVGTFAQNAVYYDYSKPDITKESIVEIENGRHPVVERLLEQSSFIPNDTLLKSDSERILIITGPNMGGKCVTPDTLIFSNKGILPISKFKPDGIKDGTFKELEIELIGINSVAKSSHFYSDGVKDTIRIKTQRGYTIEGSHNHPILVRTKTGEETWKKLSEIKNEDFIIINRKNDLWGSESKLEYEMGEHPYQVRKYKLPTAMSEDLAYLIGILIGDGTLTYKNSYYLSTKDEFLRKEFIRINEKLFGYEVKAKNNNKDYYVSSKYLRDFLLNIGLKHSKAYEKEIPEVVLKAPKKIITSFLQGLFDTDGTAEKKYGRVSLATTSKKLASQVHTILLNYGILSSLKLKKTPRRPCYEVRIYGQDSVDFYQNINFKLPRKSERSNLVTMLRMTNVDSIPYLEPILKVIKKRYLKKSQDIPSKNKMKYNKNVSSVYDSYLRQGRNISYLKLKELIDYFSNLNIECKELEDIYNKRYFYDKIAKFEYSKSEVYDFSVPESHAFVGNGIVNHNSTLLRQVALIVLMAQIGSFVPASSATIGLTDRIFTRIGAHDVLVENRSTFMVEMYECANILNNATEKSLVILDEVGRGTSTYDGVAIAWSITEYLHDHIGKNGPRTLFATHYHELIELEERMSRIKNYHVSIKNVNGDIHFLYKVEEGGISESFGIHVASLAGLPEDVITNANDRLSLLHEQEHKKNITKKADSAKIEPSKTKVSTKDSAYKEILENVSKLELDDTTPVEAFKILNELVEKSKKTLKTK